MFGILDDQFNIDVEHCKELVHLAGGLPCTFHRAIDSTVDPLKALSTVAECGFKHVLSSGGAEAAVEGVPTLRRMVNTKADARLTVIAGGGIRSDNVKLVKEETGVTWVHSAARVNGKLNLEQIDAMKMAIG